MYLVDSDVLINFLKGEKEAVEIIKKLQNQPLYVSVISVGEILEGLMDAKNKKKLTFFKEILKIVTIVNIDYTTMEKFAEIRKSLRQKGLLIDNFDLLIASSCLTCDLIIVTHNISHFKRVPGLKLYTSSPVTPM